MTHVRKTLNIPEERIVADSVGLVELAGKDGIVLRILGGFGIFIHCDHCLDGRSLQKNLGRLGEGQPAFTDLDLGGHSKQSKQVETFLERQAKLRPDMMVNALYGGRRIIYYHPTDGYAIDIFYDKLEFSHTVSFGSYPKESRLALDHPTLNLTDLVLEKIQIHDINRKDFIDLLALLRCHDVGNSGDSKSVVDAGYIANILSDDWGFWYDATNNLKSAKGFAQSLVDEGKIDASTESMLTERINRLVSVIDSKPKTSKWNGRAKTGTKKRWYEEVEEM